MNQEVISALSLNYLFQNALEKCPVEKLGNKIAENRNFGTFQIPRTSDTIWSFWS